MRLLWRAVSDARDVSVKCSMAYLHGSETTTVSGVLRGHAHTRAEDWWGRSWAVGGASRTGVVLRTSPAEADARVANWVALHLVNGHLGSVTLHELDEPASLAWRDLDVGDLAKALEERTELILGDVARKTTNKNSGVVRVSELVHGLRSAIVAHGGSAHRVHAHTRTAATLLHVHATRATGSTALVLGSRSANAHRPITTVDTLHLGKCLLLVLFVGEADKAVTARHTANRVRHDLGRLGGGVLVLEKLYEHELGDFGAKVADEDAIFGTTLIATVVLLAFVRPDEASCLVVLTCDQQGHRQKPS